MNIEQVAELKKKYKLPCVVWYIIANENFRKVYTMDDIEKPSEEFFDYHVSDLMTLGRPIPKYEEWAKHYMEMSLERKQSNTECLLTLERFHTISFDDIEKFFSDNCDNIAFQYFVDNSLNEYFEIKQVTLTTEK